MQYRMIIIRPSEISDQPSKHPIKVKTKMALQARTAPQGNHGISRDSDPHQIVFFGAGTKDYSPGWFQQSMDVSVDIIGCISQY